MMTYTVYVHTHKVDGRKYFGVTCQSLHGRWKNGQGYKGANLFYEAICKDGWNSFYHDVVRSNLTKEEAYNLEELMIREYKTQNSKYGFNRESGGLHPKHHEESIQMTAEANRGRFVSEETRLKQSSAQKKREDLHKPMPEWVKNKISKTHTGMKCSEETKQKIRIAFSESVLCVELNKTFPSSTDAAKEFGISKCTISAVLCGRNKTAAGYHWRKIN